MLVAGAVAPAFPFTRSRSAFKRPLGRRLCSLSVCSPSGSLSRAHIHPPPPASVYHCPAVSPVRSRRPPFTFSLSRSAVSVPPFASASASHFFALIVYSPTVNTLWSIYTIARFILIRRRPARLSVPRSPQPQPAPREPTSSWSSQRPSSYIATHAQVLLSPRSRSYGSPSVFPCAYGPRRARAHGLTLVPGAVRDDDNGDGVCGRGRGRGRRIGVVSVLCCECAVWARWVRTPAQAVVEGLEGGVGV